MSICYYIYRDCYKNTIMPGNSNSGRRPKSEDQKLVERLSPLEPSAFDALKKGRNIVLFPDVGGYDIWNNKISEFTSLATFRTSTLLEKNATDQEREDGLDIADYLLRIHK